MNVRERAQLVEEEAERTRTRAVLEGLYQQFDQAITSRSGEPEKLATWLFTSVSDRTVTGLAALWLKRHNIR